MKKGLLYVLLLVSCSLNVLALPIYHPDIYFLKRSNPSTSPSTTLRTSSSLRLASAGIAGRTGRLSLYPFDLSTLSGLPVLLLKKDVSLMLVNEIVKQSYLLKKYPPFVLRCPPKLSEGWSLSKDSNGLKTLNKQENPEKQFGVSPSER